VERLHLHAAKLAARCFTESLAEHGGERIGHR
jgi:hypothetical protein